jgi:hypothetical protein
MAVESITSPSATVRGALRAGSRAQGDYRCTTCGYGIVVVAFRALPECPMCRGTEWAEQRFSPFTGRRLRP